MSPTQNCFTMPCDTHFTMNKLPSSEKNFSGIKTQISEKYRFFFVQFQKSSERKMKKNLNLKEFYINRWKPKGGSHGCLSVWEISFSDSEVKQPSRNMKKASVKAIKMYAFEWDHQSDKNNKVSRTNERVEKNEPGISLSKCKSIYDRMCQ